MADTYLERKIKEIRRVIPASRNDFQEFNSQATTVLNEDELYVYHHRLLPIKFKNLRGSLIRRTQLATSMNISTHQVRLMENRVVKKLRSMGRKRSSVIEIEWQKVNSTRAISRERILERFGVDPRTRLVEMQDWGEGIVLDPGDFAYPGKRYFFLPPPS